MSQSESDKLSLDSDDQPIYSSKRKKNVNNTNNQKMMPPPRGFLLSKPTSFTKKRKRSNASSNILDEKKENDHICKMKQKQLSYSMNPEHIRKSNVKINGKYSISIYPLNQLELCLLNKKSDIKKLNFIFNGINTTPSKVLRYCHRQNLQLFYQ